jgi:hypothetical protein
MSLTDKEKKAKEFVESLIFDYEFEDGKEELQTALSIFDEVDRLREDNIRLSKSLDDTIKSTDYGRMVTMGGQISDLQVEISKLKKLT